MLRINICTGNPRRVTSRATWSPVIRGMVTSRIARTMPPLSNAVQGLRSIDDLRDHLQVRQRVEYQPQAVSEQGVVVRQQHAGGGFIRGVVMHPPDV
ncbi:MAG: hypothetical protein WAV52_05100 [Luteococcus japonicus]